MATIYRSESRQEETGDESFRRYRVFYRIVRFQRNCKLSIWVDQFAEPAYVGVADGHSLACDVYAVEIEVAGESKVVELYAVDVERIEEGDSTSEIEPLLGQGFMSFYVASFDGKQKLLTMSR